MPAIGRLTQPALTNDTLARGRLRAALIPDCLIEAQRVANIVTAGWHGRRKRGMGDNFWQLRQFTEGESVSQIDWRRSARDDNLYIRDNEWETSHTVWLWADLSPSMFFQSELSDVSKESRALVVLFALAEILCRSGERIAMPGIMAPTLARNGAERMAQALVARSKIKNKQELPDLTAITKIADIVLISDFLGDAEKLLEHIAPATKRHIRGHLIEINDPAEEVFPYSGRVEFSEPETNSRIVAGKAGKLAEDYKQAFTNRRVALREQIRRIGWSYNTHRTDRPASEILVTIHRFLAGQAAGQVTSQVQAKNKIGAT